jgi:hypothetical protein
MGRWRIGSAALMVFLFLFAALVCPAQNKPKSITIVLKDGHQRNISIPEGSRIDFKNGNMLVNHGGQQDSIPVADIVRMEFVAASSKSLPLGRNHFVGKWEFGEGNGMGSFYVTLDADGQAHKSIGSPHGTWAVVDGEARINWDDGWRDVIRKVGTKHEKFAYEPGKSLSDEPSNVANAKSLNDQPM